MDRRKLVRATLRTLEWLGGVSALLFGCLFLWGSAIAGDGAIFFWCLMIASVFLAVMFGLFIRNRVGPFAALLLAALGLWATGSLWAGLDEPRYESSPQALEYWLGIGGFFVFVGILVGGLAGITRIALARRL